jgi:tRNA(Arg) A34 adenosine deaminase TadA
VTDDRSLMRLALDEASVAADRGVPGFGAVVARAGQILARASSTEITDRNPLAHDGLAVVRGACPSSRRMLLEQPCDKTRTPSTARTKLRH